MIRLNCDLCGRKLGRDQTFDTISINGKTHIHFEACESCAESERRRLEEMREAALRPDVISEPPAEMEDAA